MSDSPPGNAERPDARQGTHAGGRSTDLAFVLSEEKYRTLVENINDVIFALDTRGCFTYISPAIERLSRYEVKEVIGQPFAQFVHPDDLGSLLADFQKTMAGNLEPFDFRVFAKDGSVVYVRTSSRPVWHEGQLTGIIGAMMNVTERKQAEKALRESEARLRALIDNLPIEFWAMDGDLRYTIQNAASIRNSGSVVGKRIGELGLPPEMAAAWTEQGNRALKGETIREESEREVDGELRAYEGLVAPVKVGDDIAGILGFAVDVTARKRAEQVMRQAHADLERRVAERTAELDRLNRMLKITSECNQVVLRSTDESSLLRDVCHAIVEMGSYSFAWVGLIEPGDPLCAVRPAATMGSDDDWLNSLHIRWADSEDGGGPTAAAIRTGRPKIVHDVQTDPSFAPWRADAARRGHASIIALPLQGDGQVFGALTICATQPNAFGHEEANMLTELAADLAYGIMSLRTRAQRSRAQQVQTALYHISEAAQTAQNLDELYRLLHGVIGELMPATNFYIALYDAPAGLISFPYYADEFDTPPPPTPLGRGRTEYVLKTGEPLLATAQVVEQLERSGQVELLGSPSVDWLGVPLKTQRGDTIGVMAVQTYDEAVRLGEADKDILVFVSTQIAMVIERKRAEEALQESEERYRRLVEQAPLGILSADRQGNITAANPALLKMLGSPSIEATRQINMLTFPPLVEAGIAGDVLRCLQSGEMIVSERLYTSKWGKTVYVRLHLTPLLDADGRVSLVQLVVEDITQRKQAEEESERLRVQVAQAQKMEAIGRLAGGIAHDFNNMLMIITGYSQIMLRRLSPDDPRALEVREVLNAAERAASLTRQLLTFSRKEILQPQMTDLNMLISNAEKMLRRLIAEDIDLVTVLGENLERVKADPGQMDQVIINLVVNACAAMPHGGKLTLMTENVTVGPAQCKAMPEARPGRFVRLTVADTGMGMDEQVMERIFEPFFTTKTSGTGLGLSVVYGIVRQHEGWIAVTSEPGQGSVFEIYIPALADTAQDEKEKRHVPLPEGHGERILLVEDDDGVRKLTRQLLEENGYAVFEAASVGEGLAVFERQGKNVHLIFSDVILPDGTALELIDRLSTPGRELRVLLSSGYTDEKSQGAIIRERGFQFLQKPYTLASLLTSIRVALDLPV